MVVNNAESEVHRRSFSDYKEGEELCMFVQDGITWRVTKAKLKDTYVANIEGIVACRVIGVSIAFIAPDDVVKLNPRETKAHFERLLMHYKPYAAEKVGDLYNVGVNSWHT